MKLATPNSLSKLSSYLTSCSSDQKSFDPSTSLKRSEILNYSSAKDHISRSRSKKVQVRVIDLSENSPNSKSENHSPEKKLSDLNYSEFKTYHLTGTKRRGSFLMKRPKSLIGSFRYKKPVLEPVKVEVEVEDTRFIQNVIYRKPALTYPEKLFRLNQVSIFN
jgi:hypothetical protein